jgi:hypothetical protein
VAIGGESRRRGPPLEDAARSRQWRVVVHVVVVVLRLTRLGAVRLRRPRSRAILRRRAPQLGLLRPQLIGRAVGRLARPRLQLLRTAQLAGLGGMSVGEGAGGGGAATSGVQLPVSRAAPRNRPRGPAPHQRPR